jgi:lycopene beta-cyclase
MRQARQPMLEARSPILPPEPVGAACAEVDVLILGGGCAGLSLAWRLLDPSSNWNGTVGIIEPRKTYERDRTWCYWAGAGGIDKAVPQEVTEAIDRSWPSWRCVGRDGHDVKRGAEGLTYNALHADTFYRIMLNRLRNHPRLTWWQGRATSVDSGWVMLDGGDRRVSVGRLVDTRPPKHYDPRGECVLRATGGAMVQQFVGREYERVDGESVDAGTCTLMDFHSVDLAPDGEIEFLYVLPETNDKALLEWTGMLAEPIEQAEAWHRLDAAAERAMPGWRPVEGGHEEAGLLPMTPQSDDVPQDGQVICLGVAGGACRPSTGYAFLQIQRQADAVAEQIQQAAPTLSVPRRPLIVQYLDAVFLRRMRRDPGAFPSVFHDLFHKVRPDRLARFLSDVPRAGDVASVIAAMPKHPFASEAVFGSRIGDRLGQWIRDDAWSAHRRLGIALTLLATVLVGLTMLAGPIPMAIQAAVLVLAASIGMAHGATDVWLGRRMFGDEAAGRLRFGGGYLLLTAAALGIYFVSPTLWLLGFLVLSALHFGLGELPGLVPRSAGETAGSLVRGLMPLTLPTVLHADAVAWAMTSLVGPDKGVATTAILSHLAYPTLACASIFVILFVLKRHWLPATEWVVVAAALVVPPPLLAFAIYFAVWHSARHLLSDVVDATRAGESADKPWLPVVVATVLPVGVAALAWLLLMVIERPIGLSGASSSAVQVVFVTLGCLTVPHMALVAASAWRATWTPTCRTSTPSFSTSYRHPTPTRI